MKQRTIKLASLIFKIKINIPDNLPLVYLLHVCLIRILMLIRGFVCIGFQSKKERLFKGKHVNILCEDMISIGMNVTFNDYVEINAIVKEGIIFGDNVLIGKSSIIRTFGSIKAIGKGFIIGNDSSMNNNCYIGAGVLFLDEIQVGNDCVIGENCLVNIDIPDYCIAVGTPTRINDKRK